MVDIIGVDIETPEEVRANLQAQKELRQARANQVSTEFGQGNLAAQGVFDAFTKFAGIEDQRLREARSNEAGMQALNNRYAELVNNGVSPAKAELQAMDVAIESFRQNGSVKAAADMMRARISKERDLELFNAQLNKLKAGSIVDDGTGLSSKEKIQIEDGMRKELDASIEDSSTVMGFYNTALAGAKIGGPQGDLGLINGAAKVFDPTGVIRPSEFQTIEEARIGFFKLMMAGGVKDTVANDIMRRIGNEVMTDADRAALLEVIAESVNARIKGAKANIADMAATAETRKLNVESVISGTAKTLNSFRPVTMTAEELVQSRKPKQETLDTVSQAEALLNGP